MRKKFPFCAVVCLTALLAPCAFAASDVDESDYTFMWWANGWRGAAPNGHKILDIQSSRFGASIDVDAATLLRLGAIDHALPYSQAVGQPNDVIDALEEVRFELSVSVGQTRFVCKSAAQDRGDSINYPVRIIESGRFLQRADVLQLVFADDAGRQLDADGRLEMIAWPDRLSLLLEITPKIDLPDAGLSLTLQTPQKTLTQSSPRTDFQAGLPVSCNLVWTPSPEPDPPPAHKVRVYDGDTELPVNYDALRGWNYVDLPERNWDMAAEPDRLDRFKATVENTADAPSCARILFAFDGTFGGITGMSPMLRDASGNPSGIPVQISKNWHRQEGRPLLYEGPWFHGATVIPLDAGQRWQGEFDVAYARWGGVPAASHAQLCLIGWGTNQLWDQVAIGSWGESICYDPDVNLNRAMIDDVRPLMVTGMNGGQWHWTVNVGGGDFLVYHDDAGKKRFLSRMRTAYLRYGPNQTEVIYAGITDDGAIEARIEVSTPRCDDINRAYHRVRYDVRRATNFSRLAFYQMGADHYNDHQFQTIARGNAEGLIEEWDSERGGKTYLRTAIPADGVAPWVSLHAGERNKAHAQGAWANRGIVVREWKARLGGKDVPAPFFAVYGTEDGLPSASIEVAPPQDLDRLEAGDFVEAEFEWLVVPQRAEDYYGPNENLRAHLAAHGGAWRPIHRQAQGNNIEVNVTRGTLERRYPIVIRADAQDSATFDIRGGLGYVPVRFTGLSRSAGFQLECSRNNEAPVIDQSNAWQTNREEDGRCSITYNLPLDSPNDEPILRRIQFHPKAPN